MKKIILLFSIVAIAIASCIKDRVSPAGQNVVNTSSDTLLYYWNFNTDTANAHIPTIGINAAATFEYAGAYADTVQPGSNINAYGADSLLADGGGALRLRNPAGPFTVSAPTTGYKNIVIKYVVEASSTTSAALTNIVTYTTDGTHYINTAIASQSPSYSVPASYTLVSFDFSSDTSVNNNPNFKVQINFANDAGNTTGKGNDRYDNITVFGKKQ